MKSNENPPLSDSDDDEVKKTNKWKGITIRPATAGPSANSSASVDELQRVVGGLDISATLPVNQCLTLSNYLMIREGLNKPFKSNCHF